MINDTVPRIVTPSVPGPNAAKLMERRNLAVSRGVSWNCELFIQEAKGALLKDVDGNVYVDFTSGIGVENIGHCDDDVVAAIREQAGLIVHSCFNIAMYEPYVALAEKLIELSPGSHAKRAMFVNSGAEAVENAVKISRFATKKQGIISLECAFHGRTFAAMSLTSKVKPYKQGFGPFLPETFKAPAAYCYRCPFGSQYPGCGLACAERLATLLKGEWSADSMAALIAEPVQGEGGIIVPPPEFLPALQSICREHGIIFVVDEIQTGFARTGHLFASEYFGIVPDILLLAKAIGGGVPLSAVIGTEAIMNAMNPGQIGGTFCGNPIACSAALRVIRKIVELRLDLQARHVGQLIQDRLRQMQERFSVIGDVRGLGAMVAVEFVKDRRTKEPRTDIVKKVIQYAHQHGVVFMSAGIFGNAIRFMPPVVITDAQAAYGMDIFEAALQEDQR